MAEPVEDPRCSSPPFRPGAERRGVLRLGLRSTSGAVGGPETLLAAWDGSGGARGLRRPETYRDAWHTLVTKK